MGQVKFDGKLPGKIEVVNVSRSTGRSVREVYGALLEFWSWAQDQRPSKGLLRGLDLEDLCQFVPGTDLTFWSEVAAQGWIQTCEAGLLIPQAKNALGVFKVHEAERETPDPAFERFWNLYPKPAARPAAVRAWARAVKKVSVAVILDGLGHWLNSEQWRRGVIPHPATWLNQERWVDSPQAASSVPVVSDARQRAQAALDRMGGPGGNKP